MPISTMAKSSLTLKLRPNPTFIRHFSSFSDIKSTLQNPPRQQINNNKDDNNVQPVSVSLDRIKKDLGEFRLRSAPPTDTPPVKPVLFQELYKRHVVSKETNSSSEMNTDGKHSFSAIRDSLRQLSINTPKTTADRLSLGKFKDSLSLRPIDQRNPAFVFGSPQKVPVLSKKMREEEGDTSSTMKTAFVKMYSYKALGEKLRKLRPEGKLEGGFTLQELNERLLKLREMEERENESGIGNPTFKDLRESLVKMQSTDKKQTMQRLDLLNHFGPTPSYMLDPPKEHLIEKYFHPDNMSSAEKLKIELQKVRDEFKMSESDCGSARVQVAQLTTKIKHLATALHPKDKHSRKGLQGMIQQRKKLLKYLRRTDWDSYTLVLSKLSLRDNPDYKN